MTNEELQRYIAQLPKLSRPKSNIRRQFESPTQDYDRVMALEATEKALKVRFKRGTIAWIPLRAIAPNSKVRKPGDHGLLVIADWLAKRFRYQD
jgi:hypothetical protein